MVPPFTSDWVGLGKIFHLEYLLEVLIFLEMLPPLKYSSEKLNDFFMTGTPSDFDLGAIKQQSDCSNLIYISISQSTLNWENYPISNEKHRDYREQMNDVKVSDEARIEEFL